MVYYKTILEAAKHFEEKKAFLFDMDGLIYRTRCWFCAGQRCLRRRPVLVLPMRRRAMSCRRAGKSG